MGFIIEGGTGNGYSVGVTSENRLKTSASISTLEHEVNHHDGQAYSVGTILTPTGPGDCFLYIKNNNDTDMVISEFMLSSVANETIIFKLGDSGTPIGGDVATPVNRNAGSGNQADVTALTGVDITGLGGGLSVMSIFLKGGESSIIRAPLSSFILPKNKVFTGYVMSGAIQVQVGMGFSFHDIGH